MSTNDTKKKIVEIKDDMANIQDRASDTKEAIIETAHDIKDNVGKIVDQSVENMKASCATLQDSAITYCKQNPLKAVGIALFSGFLLSRLIG